MARLLMYRLVSLIVLVGISFCTATLQAQITNVTDIEATPTPGVGHDYMHALNETVNPANGSLSVRIQVPVPKGRHLSLPFAFAYDSSGQYLPLANSGWMSWGNNNQYLTQGGWTYLVPTVSFITAQVAGTVNGHTVYCTYSTGFMFTDSNGTRHALRLAAWNNISICQEMSNAPINYLTAGDGIVSATTTEGFASPVTVTDADGTTYSFLAFIGSGSGGISVAVAASAEDRNGNLITYAAQSNGAFIVTDTAGRSVISSSAFGVNGNTVVVSGLSNPYTVSWGSGTSGSYNSGAVGLGQPQSCATSPWPNISVGGTTITNIQLPNGQNYKFYYDSGSGFLKQIVYPTGGWVKYTWQQNALSELAYLTFVNGIGGGGNPDNCPYHFGLPAVTTRQVSYDGSTVAEEQDFAYSTTWSTTDVTQWTTKSTAVTTHDYVRGSGTFQTTTYTYTPILLGPPPNVVYTIGTQVPFESQVVYKDWNGSVLQTVNKTWNQNVSPLLKSEQTALPNGSASMVNYSYGNLAVVTEKDEYDYGQIAPSRKTIINYQAFPVNPLGSAIYDRPCQTLVYDGSGNRMAETEYFYDNGSTSTVCGTPGMSFVTGLSNLTGHDETHYGASSTSPRGNVTTKTNKCFVGAAGCTDSVSTYTYDETGHVLSKTDPCGNPSGACSDITGTNQTTTYSYANSYTTLSGGQNIPYTPTGNTNAYLTSITDALGHTSSFMYDFNNGQLTKSTDPNTQSTTYIYNDSFARPTLINAADGGQTEVAYSDAAPSPTVTTCQLIGGTAGATCSASSPASGWKTSLATMDGLGHVVQTKLASDPDGASYTASTYDGLARAYQVYNPTRCSPPTTSCGETTWGFTTYAYDALGRATQVAEPDGSSVSTVYSSNQTTVTDEVGNQRMTQFDGLGRLSIVREAPNMSGLNYETDYSYDALNNLLNVTQKGGATSGSWRVRTFTYDSLSRLLCAANPEVQIVTCPTNSTTFPVGAIKYTYDLNSNLMTKIAPKPGQTSTAQTTIAYSYDAVNRLTQKTYTNPSGAARYGYDGVSPTGCNTTLPTITSPTNLVGRRSASCAGLSASKYSYDPMGHLITDVRVNKGSGSATAVKYTIQYSYFKDGSLNTLQYPSGDIVTYKVGDAGRTTSVKDSANNYVMPNFPCLGCATVQNEYAPFGGQGAIYLGSTTTSPNVFLQQSYNSRLQMDFVQANGSQTLLSRRYDYHPGAGDNGSVFGITDNVDSTRSTAFTYDALNRIKQANTTTTTGANCWGEVYTIDPWGNLTNRSGVPGMTGCSTEPLNAAPASVKNQLPILSYDAAGNVINDGNGNTPTYDAENRIATDAGVTYSYDADGIRIVKSPGTMYWPGPNGVLTETDLAGAINEEYVYFNGLRIARVDRPSGTVHYYFSDHLGSASVITDASSNVQEQYFYYPYGGQQSTVGSDPNHYKFTGKERDSESGLDNFGARYDASSMGRFMTPDPLPWVDWQHGNKEERQHFADFISNPQNFNMYAYVDNNPTSKTDPTGMEGCKAGDKTFSTCTIKIVYDPKTSKGTLTVLGENKGDKNPTVLLTSRVVVGGDGHVTPTGTFTATVWEKDHVSTKYGNSANTPWSKTVMGGNAFGPYQLHMKELDSRGIYIHGTMGPGWSPVTWANSIFLSPTSHGCVRMCNRDDNALHDMMPNPSGNKVIISTEEPED